LTCFSHVPILVFRGSAPVCASWSANFARSCAGKPDCCHDRRQRVIISEALSTYRRARSSGKNFIASDSALRVLAEELAIEGRSDLPRQIIGAPSAKIQQQSNSNIGANVASGSYPSDAMVIIPCSVGTLGRIANGTASHLIERAADVTLKERRPLVLCVRETPLNKIHIRNMSLAADAGATIFPLIPTFYNHPSSADAMAQEFANRVLAHIGLPQPDAYQWKG
jgi:flavin prenyltransferase